MENKINLPSWSKETGVVEVMEVLNSEGEARFVGGCVRDSIIGKAVKDIDIATTLDPESVSKLLHSEGVTVIPTGLKHGTVTAVINSRPIEITTLRKDIACDGRHAEVEFTNDWKEDAARRDFTMNALSMDMDGNIYDYFGGTGDLRNGKVKFVGEPDQRIKEDYLRILRLFRFHAYYGKEPIEPEHLSAVKINATGLNRISGERIQSEILKIFSAPNPVYAVGEMIECGVLAVVTCGDICFNINRLPSIIDVEDEVMADGNNPYLRLSAILGNPDGDKIRKISNRWKLSNDDKKYFFLINENARLIHSNLSKKEQGRIIRKIGKDNFITSILIRWSEDKEKNAEYKDMIEYAKKFNIPEFPLDGEEIKKQLGVNEGKEVGKLLKIAEEYWESENYKPDLEQIINYLVRLSDK